MTPKIYQVGNAWFGNKFLAQIDSCQKNIPIKFNLFESEFNRVSWNTEPTESWDQLLDIRAQQIAAMNKPIILSFSGGTDSLTMYHVFRRNNIKIDALYVKFKNDPKEQLLYQAVFPFIESERTKHGFHVIYAEETTDYLDSVYSTPEWVFTNMRVHFSVASGFTGIDSLPKFDSHLDDDFVFVLGVEKPRIKIINNRFYSYQSDTTWLGYFEPRNEFFYVTPKLPELHVKQSYMLANYIVELSKLENKPLEFYNNIHDVHKFDYLDYSIRGCGRIGDLANSRTQKALNRHNGLIIPGTGDIQYVGRSAEILNEGIQTDRPYAKNYIEGLRMLKSDSVMGRMFGSENNYYSVLDIESKYYELGMSV
jgi:hypothetical protein